MGQIIIPDECDCCHSSSSSGSSILMVGSIICPCPCGFFCEEDEPPPMWATVSDGGGCMCIGTQRFQLFPVSTNQLPPGVADGNWYFTGEIQNPGTCSGTTLAISVRCLDGLAWLDTSFIANGQLCSIVIPPFFVHCNPGGFGSTGEANVASCSPLMITATVPIPASEIQPGCCDCNRTSASLTVGITT